MIACAVCALPLKCVISATHIRFIRTTFANTAIITGQAIRPENVLNAVLMMFIRTAIAFTATPALALSVRNAVTAGQHFDRRMESALTVSATSAAQSWRHGMTETVFVILVHWGDAANVEPIIPKAMMGSAITAILTMASPAPTVGNILKNIDRQMAFVNIVMATSA